MEYIEREVCVCVCVYVYIHIYTYMRVLRIPERQRCIGYIESKRCVCVRMYVFGLTRVLTQSMYIMDVYISITVCLLSIAR